MATLKKKVETMVVPQFGTAVLIREESLVRPGRFFFRLDVSVQGFMRRFSAETKEEVFDQFLTEYPDAEDISVDDQTEIES